MTLPNNAIIPIGNLSGSITTGGLVPGLPIWTGEASGSIASFPDGSDNPIISLVFSIDPVQAAGTPSPSTPLPISGWTGANVTRCGKNLLAKSIDIFTIGATVENCFFVKAGTYNISYSISESHRIGVRMMDREGNIYTSNDFIPRTGFTYNSSAKAYYAGSDISSGNTSISITILMDCYIRIVSNKESTSFSNAQLELGSTATTYAPYNGTTYPITWSEAGEVYGGEIEYSDLVWSAKRKKGKVDISNFSISDLSPGRVNQTTGMIRYITSAISDKAMGRANMICNIFPTKPTTGFDTDTTETISGNSGSKAIYIVIDSNRLSGDLTTKEGRATALLNWIANNPMYIVYNLDEPTSITLDEPLPNIQTILGVNNIWSDTGDIDQVIYMRDWNIALNMLWEAVFG